MAQTFAEKMVVKLQGLLEDNVGRKTVSVDGQSVTYEDLTAELDRWKRRVLREQGKSPSIARIRLGGL